MPLTSGLIPAPTVDIFEFTGHPRQSKGTVFPTTECRRDNWPDVPTPTRRGCEEWRGAIQTPELGFSYARLVSSLLRPLRQLLPAIQTITLPRTFGVALGDCHCLGKPRRYGLFGTRPPPPLTTPPPTLLNAACHTYERTEHTTLSRRGGCGPGRRCSVAHRPLLGINNIPAGLGGARRLFSPVPLAESQLEVSDRPVHAPQRHTFQAEQSRRQRGFATSPRRHPRGSRTRAFG